MCFGWSLGWSSTDWGTQKCIGWVDVTSIGRHGWRYRKREDGEWSVCICD